MQTLNDRANISLPSLHPPNLCWEEIANLPTLDAAVLKVTSVYDFLAHPYLTWMQLDTTSRDAFRLTQLPFRFAVESFSQALAAVLARIPVLEARLPIFFNIAEEHGRGDRQLSHKYTFRQYLQALGATEAELATLCTVSVLAFNQSILSYCLTQSAAAGAAMLGTIEYLYVGISSTISSTIDRRAWTIKGSQSHYTIHEKLDTEHAKDLLMLATPAWDEFSSRATIAQGLILGAYYFWSLYRDLLPSY
ncbi:MAG: iron-containing redox enzyme family protein [Microcoleus sp.]